MSYFEITGQDKIGNLDISRKEIWNSQKAQINIAGFKVNVFERTDNSVQGGASMNVYISGWITRTREFYRVPLLLNYLQIDRITTIRTWNDIEVDKTIIDLIIFSRDLQDFEAKSITITNTYDIKYALQVINYLNDFIDNKGDIINIDLTKFNNNTLKPLDRSYVLNVIEKLDFEYYEDSLNRVGKENFFWKDFVAINLPKETYLRNIFEKILRENCSHFSIGNNSFVITEYDDNEYAPAYPRRKIEGVGFGQNYKEILRYETAKHLSFHELISSRISSIS